MKLPRKRKDSEGVYVIEKLGWKFHHMGIPTHLPIENERYIPGLDMYVSGFETSPYGVEWMRFGNKCTLPDIVKKVSHPAFEVENLDAILEEYDFEIITPPNSPSDEVRVAMILHNNVPVELIEFTSKKPDND